MTLCLPVSLFILMRDSLYPPFFQHLLSDASFLNKWMCEQWSLQFFWSLWHSIPFACAECDNSLPFSAASSILLLYKLPQTSLPFSLTSSYHLFFGPTLVVPKFIYNTFWEFYFLPFSVHAQTNIIYLTILSLL